MLVNRRRSVRYCAGGSFTVRLVRRDEGDSCMAFLLRVRAAANSSQHPSLQGKKTSDG